MGSTDIQITDASAVTVQVNTNTTSATSAQLITLSSSVTGMNGTPTGSITFMDGTTALGTVALAYGSASYTFPPAWTIGSHAFSASYSGDGSHAASASTSVSVVVLPEHYQVVHGRPLLVASSNGLLRYDPYTAAAEPVAPIILTNPAHGELTIFDDGSFVYISTAAYTGTDSFTYSASNPQGIGTVTLSITDAAPVAVGESYTLPHDRTFSIESGSGVLANDADPDGDRLSSRLITGPAHGTLALNPYGFFAYKPNAGFVGTDSFTYAASDGAMDSAPVLVTLNVVDAAPSGQNRSYSTSPDLPLRITTGGLLAGATDPEGDVLTAILVAGPANGRVSLARDGSFGYLANPGFTGLDHFTFRITDGALESAAYTASIQVAGAAPSTVDGQFSVVHDGTLFVPFDRGLSTLATSNNPNGTLSFTLSAGPSHGTVTVYARGAFTYTPDAGYTGDDSFSFTASDGYVASGAATVVIHVTDVAPIAAAKAFAAVGGRPLFASAFDGVLSGASDADGDWITASLVSGPGHGALSLNADGSFVYTPDGGFVGTDTFSFRPSDGVQYGLAKVISLVVSPDPDHAGGAPTAANDTLQILHDTTLTVAASLGILANDSDAGGRPLTAQLVAGPVHGTLVLNARGSFQYVPHAGYVGSDSFTYKAHNGQVGSATATVHLAVTDAAPTAAPSTHTAPHGRTLVVPISRGALAGASDADGDLLSAILVGSPSHGTVALAADGSFAYIPDAGYVGIDTFTFAASDGVLAGAATTVTILLTDGAPSAGATQYQINHDGILVVAAWNGVLTAAADPEGDAVAAVLLTGPAHGSLDLHADGSFVYTPNAGYIGSDSFSFSPTDGVLMGSPITVGLTVANPPLIAQDAVFLFAPGATLTVGSAGGLLNYGFDPVGLIPSAALVSGPSHGTLVLASNGTFTYTPDAGYTGNDSFAYTLGDGYAASNPATVVLKALAASANPLTVAPPSALDRTYALGHDTLFSTLTQGTGVLTGATDPQGFPLVATLLGNVQHGKLVLLADGEFLYRPDAGYFGSDHFTYRATSGLAFSETATITLQVAETAPQAGPSVSHAVAAGSSLFVGRTAGLLVGASDAEGDYLRAVLASGPAHGALSLFPDGSFGYTPEAGYVGSDSFAFSVGDGILASELRTVSLAVTDPPSTIVSTAFSVLHDTMLIASAAPVGAAGSIPALPGLPGSGGRGILAGAINPSGNPLSAVLVDGPAHGTLVFGANGSFRYTPDAGYLGADSFTAYATDGIVSSPVTTISIAVTDRAPTAPNLAFSTLHDRLLLVGAGAGLMAGAADADGDPMTLAILSQPAHGTLTPNADGSFRYTPDAGYHGTDSFTYSVGDGVLSSGVATVVLTVVEHAPTAASPTIRVTHDTQYLADARNGLLSYAADADGDALTLTVLTQPTHGTLTTFPNGAFKYVADAGYAGVDSFTYKVGDGVLDSAVGTIYLDVANSAPVAADRTFTVKHDRTLGVAAWSRDGAGVQGLVAGGTDADGDPLTIAVPSQPTHGTLQMFANGGFLYTPDAGFAGSDSFTYTLNDGIAMSATATVSITVVNTAPTISTSVYKVDRDGILNVADPSKGALASPSQDAEGDAVTATLTSTTTHGTLTFKPDGTFLYRPNAGYIGTDSFTFSVSDGIATVSTTNTITVANRAPVAKNVSYEVWLDHALVVDAPDVTNDGVLGNVISPSGDPVTAILKQGSTQGVLVLNPDGSFTYTPNAGALGQDTFQYAAKDGYQEGNTATVTLTLGGDLHTNFLSQVKALRASVTSDATASLNRAKLAAEITRSSTEFASMAVFNAASRAEGAIVAQAETAQAKNLKTAQITLQAADDVKQKAAAAVYSASRMASDSQRWSSQAVADQTYSDALAAANLTAVAALDAAAVANQIAQVAANAVDTGAQSAAYLVQVASYAAAEDAYNATATTLQAGYRIAQSQAVAAYAVDLANAASAEASALAAAEASYQNALSGAETTAQIYENFALTVFELSVSNAQTFRALALQTAQTQYDDAVAAAAAAYGVSQSGDPAPPDAPTDPAYLTAVTQARAAYAAAADAAEGIYRSIHNAALVVRTNAIASARTAYNQTAASAWIARRDAFAAASSGYQSALTAAQATHDLAVAGAQATTRASLRSATTLWNAGLQAANQAYDAAIAGDRTAYQAAVDAARADYRATLNTLASAYATSSAAAGSTYSITIRADQKAFDTAAALARATQTVAIADADASYQSQVKSVVRGETLSQMVAQDAFHSLQSGTMSAYELAIENAKNDNKHAIAEAESLFDWKAYKDIVIHRAKLARANAIWTAEFAEAQLEFTRSSFLSAASSIPLSGNDTAMQERRKKLEIRQKEADLRYQKAAADAAIALLIAEKDHAATQAQDISEAAEAQVDALQGAGTAISIELAPAEAALKNAMEDSTAAVANAVATAAASSSQAVEAADVAYQRSITAALKIQTAVDAAALVAWQTAINTASKTYDNGQNAALRTISGAVDLASKALDTAVAGHHAEWAAAYVGSYDTYQSSANVAYAALSGATALAQTTLLTDRFAAQHMQTAAVNSAHADYFGAISVAAGIEEGALAAAGRNFAQTRGAAWAGAATVLANAWAAERSAETAAAAEVVEDWSVGVATDSSRYIAAVSLAGANRAAAANGADAAYAQAWNGHYAGGAGYSSSLASLGSNWEAAAGLAFGTRIGNRAAAEANAQNAAGAAGVGRTATQNANAAVFQGGLAAAAGSRNASQISADLAWTRSDALARSALAARVEAAYLARNAADVDPLVAWAAALTDAGNANADAIAAAEKVWLDADAAALENGVEAAAAADAEFYSLLWAAWKEASHDMVAAGQTQIKQVGDAAVELATQLVAAERAFGDGLSAAFGANGRKLAAAAWAYRVSEARVLSGRAVDNTTRELAELRAKDPSKFTTLQSAAGDGGVASGILGLLDYFSGGTSNRVLLSAEFGAALDAVDGFFAGMADALTAGLSTRARAGMYGDSATKNHQGGYFVAGQITGTVLGMAIGAGSPCALGTGFKIGFRVLEGAQILGGSINAGQNLAEGNYLAAAGDAVGVVGGISNFLKACFVAGTPIVTRHGSKPIESFRSFEDHGEDCDWVLSREEHNDDAEPRFRRVLRTFERLSPVLWLTIDGQRIGTTHEHPFFVRGKRWTDAGELRAGDELRLLTPGWTKVEAVRATNDLVTVYNMQVEDDHTYFVGDLTWGWSVWAHNSNACGKELANIVIAGWKSGKELVHFVKHGLQLGLATQKKYTAAAKAFAAENGPLMLVVKMGNHFFKYDQATQRILIMNGRNIKTFYRANDGIRSFYKAIAENADHLRQQTGKPIIPHVLGYGPW